MGRRVEKRVYTWQYVADHYDWVDSDCRRFVYYNRLPLLEIQVTNPYSQGVAGGPPAESAAILRKYTWGLDLAGQNGSVNSIDAAGGIGGLLACYDTNGTTTGEFPTADDEKFIYFYDANGNVGQVLDWTNAAITPPSTAWGAARMVATYEYDPYGNVTASAGDYADDNPFRFSTKYWDDETGLGYWGYRYYSPRLGRWVSRDLLEENDSNNIYCGLSNSPMMHYDLYGLASESSIGDIGFVPPGSRMLSSQSAIDTTQACCFYTETEINLAYGAQGVSGSSFRNCYKQEKCPKTTTSPEQCCGCACEINNMLYRFQRRLTGAKYGKCCFCTMTVRRQSWFYGLPHHEVIIDCPHFFLRIDRWSSTNNWKGPAPIRFWYGAGTTTHTAYSKHIPCEAADSLRATLKSTYPKSASGNGLDYENECFPFDTCYKFAYRWYHAGGKEWSPCR